MKTSSSKKKPLNIFYSYSHKNAKQRADMSKYLAPFRRDGLIKEWYDGNIEGGDEFERAIDKNLYIADIIILMITIDFVNSDYCWIKEMGEALRLHNKNRARVIPIIVQPIPVEISATPFGKLKVLPKDGKPVTTWINNNAGWNDAAKGIGEILKNWKPGKKQPAKKPGKELQTEAFVENAIAEEKAPAQHQAKRSKDKVNRLIYDAQHRETIPGKLIRKEGDAPVGDKVVDSVYDNLGKVYDFFFNVYGRNSADNKGLPVTAVVHYSKNFGSIFWDGRNIVIGDGDKLLNNFYDLEFLAIDFTYAIIQYESQLEYWGQSGALITASGHIFGSLAKQYQAKQTAQEASWLIGENSMIKKGIARGFFSLANPGTAYYGHPDLGADPGKFHIRDMVQPDKNNFDYDSGGVHTNCGIPARAFYLAATMIEGYAWEKAGRIWYESLCSKDLPKAPTFFDFAKISVAVAEKLFNKNSIPSLAFTRGWELVGIDVSKKPEKKQGKKRRSASK